jgi:hypothetical protein
VVRAAIRAVSGCVSEEHLCFASQTLSPPPFSVASPSPSPFHPRPLCFSLSLPSPSRHGRNKINLEKGRTTHARTAPHRLRNPFLTLIRKPRYSGRRERARAVFFLVPIRDVVPEQAPRDGPHEAVRLHLGRTVFLLLDSCFPG